MSSQTLNPRSLTTASLTHRNLQSREVRERLADILLLGKIPLVTADKTASGLELIQKLTAHNVPCIVILEHHQSHQSTHDSRQQLSISPLSPVGLVVAQDIIQVQVSGQSITDISARDLLKTDGLCLLSAELSIRVAYQILIQKRASYGLVVDERGSLVGVISQTLLLQQMFESVNPKQDIEALQYQLVQEKKTHQQTLEKLAIANATLEQVQQKQTIQEAQLKKNLLKRQRVESALRETLRELKATQAHIIQKERMAGLGQLIAGIAHEINNPVSFIYGNLEPAQQYSEDLFTLINYYQKALPKLAQPIEADIDFIDLDLIAEDFPKILDSMEMGANRIRDIVKSLQNFSHLDEAALKTIDVHQGIDNTLMTLQYRLMEQPDQARICVNKHYGQLPKVECFASQLNQVFWHLLSNAIDALRSQYCYSPEWGQQQIPREIDISTEVLPENKIAIHFTDNGPGIPDACQAQIFDPFYTTKAVGQGPGLGLAISYQIIVLRHQGKLKFNSVPNGGTRFTLELPYNQG